MSITIELTEQQLHAANAEALRRQTQNEARKLRGRNRAPAVGEKALKLHQLGCIGEVAAASFLGLSGQEFALKDAVRGSSDLPGNIEVKTRPKHGYDLLIQINDDPGKIFVLITYDGITTQVAGWIRGHDAMKKEWIKEYIPNRPCYAVKQSELNPPETLQEALNGSFPRVLESHEAWITEAGDGTDDLFLNFNPGLMERLGWEVGDTLTWTVDAARNQCIIKKINDERTQDQAVGLRV